MSGRKVVVLPNQLPLFAEGELSEVERAPHGYCPVCQSPAIKIERRWRWTDTKRCMECHKSWIGK
jgi:RNA polymerase-binding transcription factor DksA